MYSFRSFKILRFLMLALLAAGMGVRRANAQAYRGKFTLPFDARWGEAVLPKGDYTFDLDQATLNGVVLIRHGTQNRAMIMAVGTSQRSATGHDALLAVRSQGGYTIRTLDLPGINLVLYYPLPGKSKQIVAQKPELIVRVPVSAAGK